MPGRSKPHESSDDAKRSQHLALWIGSIGTAVAALAAVVTILITLSDNGDGEAQGPPNDPAVTSGTGPQLSTVASPTGPQPVPSGTPVIDTVEVDPQEGGATALRVTGHGGEPSPIEGIYVVARPPDAKDNTWQSSRPARVNRSGVWLAVLLVEAGSERYSLVAVIAPRVIMAAPSCPPGTQECAPVGGDPDLRRGPNSPSVTAESQPYSVET
jgi:hypothetical protein